MTENLLIALGLLGVLLAVLLWRVLSRLGTLIEHMAEIRRWVPRVTRCSLQFDAVDPVIERRGAP